MEALNGKRNSTDGDILIDDDVHNYGEKRRFCLEWCQLIATICIPIIIAIYTIIQDRQDLNKANMARASELQIAHDSRLKDLLIAENNLQKDRDLALDQQRENILVEYHRFLSGLLSQTSASQLQKHHKSVISWMSHTTINQLNSKRKRYVIRSLYEAKLITLNVNSKPMDVSVVEFTGVDLSNTVLGSVHVSQNSLPITFLIDWYYLYLPRTIFRNASIRHAFLHCATLFNSNFDYADLSFSLVRQKCFTNIPDFYSNMNQSSFVNATLHGADFTGVDFRDSNFTFANMSQLRAVSCDFRESILIRTDLSRCHIFDGHLGKRISTFHSVNLSHAIVHQGLLSRINFSYSDWSYVQATQIRLYNCTFANATMTYASFVQGYIAQLSFQQTDLSHIDLSYAVLQNVTFINTNMNHANLSYMKCEYCRFTNVDLRSSVLKNASLRYANFMNCLIDDHQLAETVDLTGSQLPNGTIVENNVLDE